MPRIVIGVPCMDSVSTSFFSSILTQRYTPGYQFSYAIEAGSVVYTARARIVQRAIMAEADYCIMYDSDMVLEPDTTMKLVEAIEGRKLPQSPAATAPSEREPVPKDFVTGLYFMRRLPTKPLILKSVDRYEDEYGWQNYVETYEDYPKNSLFEIAAAGFGCCIMRMSMVKDLIERCKGNPFQPLPELSEDYSFCYQAKQAGYKLWCDSRIRPGHAGLHIYTESDWMKQQKQAQTAQNADRDAELGADGLPLPAGNGKKRMKDVVCE